MRAHLWSDREKKRFVKAPDKYLDTFYYHAQFTVGRRGVGVAIIVLQLLVTSIERRLNSELVSVNQHLNLKISGTSVCFPVMLDSGEGEFMFVTFVGGNALQFGN